MAAQTESSTPPSAEIVGNAFVEQYYLILHQSPELVHRFYQDSSVLSRPGPDGVMATVTTMQGINEKILSLEYNNYKAEILTADAQVSYKDGVTVLVTGCLTGKDNVRRKFTQSFFLAPQNNGYFVLNDVFRYVDDKQVVMADTLPVNIDAENAPKATLNPAPEPPQVADNSVVVNDTTSVLEKEDGNKNDASLPPANVDVNVIEKEVVIEAAPANSGQGDVLQTAVDTSSNIKENAPKKSFASIVNELKENNAPFHVKVSPAKRPAQPRVSAPVEAPVANANSVPEKNQNVSVKSHSIFVGKLPMNATPAQLREAFERFGPIKSNGIQVRSNKVLGFCFGFVEFESASSMEEALKANDVMVGGSKVNIEEAKKNRDNNDRGRFPSGRGGFRNDHFRGRGNYGARYGRNEFERRPEYRNRRNVEGGQNGEAYQKVYQNGGARAAARQAVPA